MNEAMHDILESADFDKLLDDCSTARAGLYLKAINNEGEPAYIAKNAGTGNKIYTTEYS